MSRIRWILPLLVAFGPGLRACISSAQQGGARAEHRSVLMVENSSLRLFEPRTAEPPKTLVEADISYLFSPSEWLAEATPAPSEYRLFFVPYTSTRARSFLGMLTVSCPANRPPEEVKKVAALAEKRLEQALVKIHETNTASLIDRVRRAEMRVAEARDVAEKRRSELQSLRTQLVRADASPEGIDQQQNTLRQDRLKLRVELVGLKARREAIVKAVAEASDKLKATSEEQQRELAELQKIVDIRVQAVSRAQQLAKQAAISTNDYQQTELELSRARADLAERRRVIAQQAGSDQLSRLNQQLADVQIEMAAAEARIADIERMLDRLQSKEVADLLSEYGRATQQLEYARAEEKAAFEQLAEAKKTAESTPAPKVVEIRGAAAGERTRP
jgi:hypothetical protein